MRRVRNYSNDDKNGERHTQERRSPKKQDHKHWVRDDYEEVPTNNRHPLKNGKGNRKSSPESKQNSPRSRSTRFERATQPLNNKKTPKKLFYIPHNNLEETARKEKEIAALKTQAMICPICGKQIDDIASSISDKNTQNPIHFECAMAEVAKTEHCGENEKICYIGQGRFGVLYFENPRDQRHFVIKKIINIEDTNTVAPWRSKLSELYSQIE